MLAFVFYLNTVKGGKYLLNIQNKNYFERKRLYSLFEDSTKNNKILYIHSNTGYGKTLTTLRWLEKTNKKYYYLSAADEFFFDHLQSTEPTPPYIVLDDISCITDETEQEQIFQYIMRSHSKFIILSRADMSAFLMPILAIGQMKVLNQSKLAFTEEELKEFLKSEKIVLTDEEIQSLLFKSYAIPLIITFAIGHLKNGASFEVLYEKTKQDYFNYLDFAIYRKLTATQRNYLLDLASVMKFSTKLAIMITGAKNISEELYKITDFSNIFIFNKPDNFEFLNSEMHDFFLQKQKQKLEKKTILQLYQKIALHYELEGDFQQAMHYYNLGENRDKLSALLVENTKRTPLAARFYEVEKYYFELNEAQILSSPELMSGMSMLQSLRFNPKVSEYWYGKLNDFIQQLNEKDGRYKIAKEKLMYLDIALPHRGSQNTLDIIKNAAATLLSTKTLKQEVCATGDMPSLINGGMDFLNWSKNEKIIYATIKKPLELVLGKSAVGLMDTGLGEMLFEKNDDLNFTESLTYLNTALSEITLNGTKQIEFATLGVMSRIFVASGSMPSARRLIESYFEKVRDDPMLTMQDNVEALLTLFNLYTGDSKSIEKWFEIKAPNELDVFYILKRLQYLVKVRIYILKGNYMSALSLLDKLKIYYETYHRPYGTMQTAILRAITHYRMEATCWEEELNSVLLQCEKYSFTRIIADEGMAILEPLLKLDYTGDMKYYKTIISLARNHAILYPKYLVKEQTEIDSLTEMERNVLRLLAQGMTNEKIAELLGVTIRTIKFHTGNIYSKMNVKNRATAIVKAKEIKEF